ncbi:hypothetical protein Patl1_31218 [Pistacia atlantica]|uniref:Uncharacterized protein n=1 Tax=Pistacia atlantica TaxID=434234 RepID=A0ACC1A7Q3_9ROSI|nr:hypothetical protein Patl1_31218 [Pistacia atlantica]
MEKQGKRSNRLVLVPGSFQGHLNPMLQPGTILYSRGFSITVAHTKFNSSNPSNHPDFNFLTISYVAYDSDLSSGNILALILRLDVNCKAPFQECLARLTEKQNSDEEKISCIIYDELMYFSSGRLRDEASEHYLAHRWYNRLHFSRCHCPTGRRSWIKRHSARILSTKVKGSTFFEIRVIRNYDTSGERVALGKAALLTIP